MTKRSFSLSAVLIALLMPIIVVMTRSATTQGTFAASSVGSTPPSEADVRGTWSGTFLSKHPHVPSFLMRVVINRDGNGRLVGNSTLNSECIKGVSLQVTVTDSQVVLAGSDREGDSLTVRGVVDNTGTIMETGYIMNGSASGRCETDDGTGRLARQ